jgi:branched-subunit amino acid aminotransferase/4-amino-4-deoxychorismate lyase
MSLAYLNGRFVPASQAVVPVYDAGFVLGATVAEQVRTFGGRLFRLEKHLARLAHSLEIVGVDSGISLCDLQAAAEELAGRNHALLDPGDDLGISIFVTPGPYATMVSTLEPDARIGPTVGMHTYPLPFHLWAEKYRTGQVVVVTDVQQVPPVCWPPELKCRSRMHYYLADSQARKFEPGARALLLDGDGHVLEASTANIVVHRRDAGLVSPPKEKILPGVSVGVVTELARSLGIPFVHRDLTVDDLATADEVMLCSTSPCVWPVVRLNGETISGGVPGEVFRKLLAGWNALVGLDIQAQAERFARRR